MFSNAVSTAVGRLYAGATTNLPRVQVQPVLPVARVTRGVPGDAPDPDENSGHAAQRQALAEGVRAVFESSIGVEAGTEAADAAEDAERLPGSMAHAVDREADSADPRLEEAIIRFIHSVFRGLAEAEGAAPGHVDPDAAAPGRDDGSAVATAAATGRDSGTLATTAEPARAGSPPRSGSAGSRDQLARRIATLADKVGRGGAPADPLHALRGSDGDIARNFAGVVNALGAGGDIVPPAATTRADLVTLMHRLAHAMHGTPPIDEGLPTRGGLLHARA